MGKSSLVAHFAYVLGGAFGLHHLYLKRTSQAFLWAVSFGGFGLGTTRDLLNVRRYTKEANGDSAVMEVLATKMKHQAKPGVAFSHVVAMIIFGFWFKLVASCTVPAPEPDSNDLVFAVLNCLSLLAGSCGAALAVHLVGTSPSHQTCGLKPSLLGRQGSPRSYHSTRPQHTTYNMQHANTHC
jgi:hypothetical protein